MAFLAAMFLVALWTVVAPGKAANHHHDSSLSWILLASVFQLIMVVPHELGHALAARWLGYRDIRILIGSGRAVWQFNWLGFQWLLNRVPFGGLTLANPSATGTTRWKQLCFVAAGPAVSLAAVLLWLGWVGDDWRTNLWTIPGAFVGANLFILVENLIPREVHTGYGIMANDGLLIWRILFQWGKPPVIRNNGPGKHMVFLSHVFRWGIVVLLFAAFLAFGIVIVLVLGSHDAALSWTNRLLMGGVFLVLAIASGKLGWGLAREPIQSEPVPKPTRVEERLPAELAARSIWRKTESHPKQIALFKICHSGDLRRMEAAVETALRNYPGDPMLRLQLALVHLQTGQSVLAEQGFASLLAGVNDLSPLARCTLLCMHLQSVMALNDLARVEQLGMTYLQTLSGVVQKTRLLDWLATGFLSREPSANLPQAEVWARQALALDPSALTLKGTLGSVLVEQGKFAEGEPYLRECFERSPALNDQGIAAFYLACVEANQGNLPQARALARQATVLHRQPWLVQKATRKLAEWESPGARI